MTKATDSTKKLMAELEQLRASVRDLKERNRELVSRNEWQAEALADIREALGIPYQPRGLIGYVEHAKQLALRLRELEAEMSMLKERSLETNEDGP